jgi:hypothetical protein
VLWETEVTVKITLGTLLAVNPPFVMVQVPLEVVTQLPEPFAPLLHVPVTVAPWTGSFEAS